MDVADGVVVAVLRALWYVLAVRHGAKIRVAWRIFGTKDEFSMLVVRRGDSGSGSGDPLPAIVFFLFVYGRPSASGYRRASFLTFATQPAQRMFIWTPDRTGHPFTKQHRRFRGRCGVPEPIIWPYLTEIQAVCCAKM